MSVPTGGEVPAACVCPVPHSPSIFSMPCSALADRVSSFMASCFSNCRGRVAAWAAVTHGKCQDHFRGGRTREDFYSKQLSGEKKKERE